MPIVFSETWDVDIGGDDFANAARVTDPVYAGAGALRLQPTAAVAYWEKNAVGGAQSILVARFFLRFGVFPGADVRVIHAESASHDISINYDTATGQLGCSIDSSFQGGLGGPVLALDTWYAIDFKADHSAALLTADGRVNGVALPQAADTFVSGTYSAYKLGPNNEAVTMTTYYDELQVSHTAGDYPLVVGPGPADAAPFSRLGRGAGW